LGRGKKINILPSKNFIKLFFAIALTVPVFGNCSYVYNSAFGYEMVEAETVIPEVKNKLPVEEDQKLNAGVEKEGIRIPNPLDELLLRKIKESNKAAQNAPKQDKKEGVLIDSKKLEYFEATGELEATGDVVIKSANGTVVTADRAVYDKNLNVIKLYDNVVLIKEGNRLNGEYMAIDLNEENALMDTVTASFGTLVRMRSPEAYAYSDRIEAVNGSIELARKLELNLQTSGFESLGNMLVQDDEIMFDVKRKRLSAYKIRAKEITVESQKDHDVLTLKNADLYYKKTKIVTLNSMELFSDKEMNYIEANIPVDMGSISDFGQYIGLGYIFKLPTGANLKVAPALVYDDELGVGALATLKTKRLDLDAAWATSSENLILDGEYKFTKALSAQFGRHAYKDEWFLGSKRAGHLAQLVYDDSYNVKDINATFRHRITAGYASDYHKEHQESNNYGTMRFRWQNELSKEIFSVSNKEQDMKLAFGVFGQSMATVYGTGETTALVRGGPSISSRIKNWKSVISYAVGGFHGASPFKFDEYTYGKSSINVDESIKISKYLSLGYRGTISPLKDNSDDDLLTENRFYAVAGPEDIKLALSYDTIRHNAHLDVMFLLGTDVADIGFEKMTIKNPDKLRKKTPLFNKDNIPYRKIKVPEDL